jgi:hypothetical protein
MQRREPGHDLDFEDCLDKWPTEEFKEVVLERLAELESELPLDHLCESGGGPDWEDSAEFDLGDPEERGNIISFSGDVWFKESISTGCRDINFTEDRHGRIFVEIQKDSGRADVTVERSERRNLENY